MRYILDKPLQGQSMPDRYQCTIHWRNGQFVTDEPATSGGGDQGPDPYSLLLSSLASCTLITLRMYIERKEWDIKDITVNVNFYQQLQNEQLVTTIDRDIRFLNPVTEEQRARLREIADHCPISKLLRGEMHIRTYTYSEGETQKTIKYNSEEITVNWKPELCKHSGRCVHGLPKVFNVNAHPWVNIEGASAEDIKNQVEKCPTGALSYKLHGIGE